MSALSAGPFYDWKPLNMQLNTGAATFGVIVPSNMHMQIREIDYTNKTTTTNEAILRQIPSGNIRPSSQTILDDEVLTPASPSYSPRIPIRVIQENCVIEASSTQGPLSVTLAYRLRYGRP